MKVTKRPMETVSDKLTPLRNTGLHTGWWVVRPRPFRVGCCLNHRFPQPPFKYACLTPLAKSSAHMKMLLLLTNHSKHTHTHTLMDGDLMSKI